MYDVDLHTMTAKHRVQCAVRKLSVNADGVWSWRIPIDRDTYMGVPDRHQTRLYANTLVRAYNRVHAESPGRAMIVLNHFCLSGGRCHLLQLFPLRFPYALNRRFASYITLLPV